jgi:hypothetical protein
MVVDVELDPGGCSGSESPSGERGLSLRRGQLTVSVATFGIVSVWLTIWSLVGPIFGHLSSLPSGAFVSQPAGYAFLSWHHTRGQAPIGRAVDHACQAAGTSDAAAKLAAAVSDVACAGFGDLHLVQLLRLVVQEISIPPYRSNR